MLKKPERGPVQCGTPRVLIQICGAKVSKTAERRVRLGVEQVAAKCLQWRSRPVWGRQAVVKSPHRSGDRNKE